MTKKSVVLFTVFIDVLGFGVVIPTLPFYVQSFGASAITVTALFSVYALFSFISAPFLGALSDRIGRRPVLITSIISTALGWLIFAAARNILFLFIGRIIDGLAAGNISTAQSYLIDLSKDKKERTDNLGKIGAIFGIALIIGPTLGGFLGSIFPSLPFWFVGLLATVNAIMAYFNLPESHHKRSTEKISLNPFKPIIDSMSDRALLPGLIAFFLFGFAITIQQSVFALYLDKVFNYGAFVSGLFLTAVGIIIAINQGLLLKRFWLKHFAEPKLELYMLFGLGVGFLLMSIEYFIVFILGMILITFGQSITRVVMSSQIVGKSKQNQGQTMGTMSSLMSLSMILGPIIAGPLFVFRHNLPFLLSGIIIFTSFGVIFFNRALFNKISKAEDANTNFPL